MILSTMFIYPGSVSVSYNAAVCSLPWVREIFTDFSIYMYQVSESSC